MPLNIVQPANGALFNIDASPRMPAIQCQARITGVTPDPTASTPIDWSIVVTETVRASSCPSSHVGTLRLTVNRPGVMGVWRPAFPSIQGGDAVITARATLRGAPMQATVNVRVRGSNPSALAVTQRLGGAGTAADYIACHESGRRQFDPASGMPLLGPGGDVGIMQLCNPPATTAQRWDWTANLAAGLALLNNDKAAAARNHLNQHQVGGHYPNDQNLNDADVLLRETIQRYNGGAYWRWDAAHNRWVAAPPNNYVATVMACH